MFVRTQISTLILMVSTASFTFAQTEDVDMFAEEGNAIVVASSSDESGAFGTTIMSMNASELGDGGMIFDSVLGGSMGFSVAGSDFSLLNDVSVQKDLNLVDGQLERIDEINKEFEEKMREKMDAMRDANGNFSINGADGFGDLFTDLKNRQQDEINSILLPNQQDRLKQVARQMKMKRLGSERALTKVLAEELGLTAEQTRKIKEKSKQLQEELNEKFAKLKADAKNELFAELSKEQREKLEGLLGEEFVVKDEDDKSKFRRIIRRSQSQARDF